MEMERLGYRILEVNYRCRYGEADLVAQDGETFVFVEVKTRRSSAFGTAQESLTQAKKRKLMLAGQYYLSERGLDVPWRIDVIAINALKGHALQVEVIRNAVTEEDAG
jgi:putative endonuclease